MAILACRTATPPSLLDETFGPKKIHIPKAPPLGLLLQQPQFKTYNERIQDNPGGMTEHRDPVDFGLYQEEMEKFKVKFIYERLREEELETSVYVSNPGWDLSRSLTRHDCSFHKWLRQMDCSSGKMLSFLK